MKCLLYICRIKSWGLDVIQIVNLRILFYFWYWYTSLFICQICFISNKKDAHTIRTLLFQFLDPIIYIHKSLMIRNIVDYQCSNSTSIVRRSHCSVSFLTSGVPYLSFYGLIVCVDSLCSKLYSNSCFALKIEFILGKPTQQLRFPHASISYQYNFEKEIVFTWFGVGGSWVILYVFHLIKCCH